MAASTYLQSVQARLSDHDLLVRREIDMMLDALSRKASYFEELRQQVRRHRAEDITQLTQARRQAWASWDERLRRIEEWMKSATELKRAMSTLHAWKQSAQGFERLQSITEKFSARLARRAKSLQIEMLALGEARAQWEDNLRVQEADLRGFLDRQAAKTTELMVSKARKQPYLDFIYREREEEGRLSMHMKSARASVNRMLDRLGRLEAWVTEGVKADPEAFAARQESFLRQVVPFRKQFSDIREKLLEHALSFEGGRQRLRWIYEQVQRMRVVPDAPSARTPLIERFFGPRD